MKTKILFAITIALFLTLSAVVFAYTGANTVSTTESCCKMKDCCKDGKCSMSKDGKCSCAKDQSAMSGITDDCCHGKDSCPMMKDKAKGKKKHTTNTK